MPPRINIDERALRMLCKSSMTNSEVATTLGISLSAVRALCFRYDIESPWQRKKRLKKEQRTGKRSSDGLPDPIFEAHGPEGTLRKQSSEESAARLALQPPIRHIDPSEHKPAEVVNVREMYSEKHYDVVGRPRYPEEIGH